MEEDFRSHVLRSAYKSESSVLILLQSFGCAHVDQFQIAVSSNHDILGLQIPIQQSFRVQILQSQQETGSIESCLFGGKNTNGAHDIEQISSFDVFSQKVKIVFVLERTIVFQEERVLSEGQE